MRFKVGQRLLTVWFEYEVVNQDANQSVNHGFTMPFLYNKNPIKEIHLKWLTVEEHHKVGDGYSDKLDCDGYILKDETGLTWTNQYPVASYGQLSDELNRRFYLDLNGDNSGNVKLCETHLLSDVIDIMEVGLKNLAKTESNSQADFLKLNLRKTLDDINGLLFKQGLKVEFKPIWKDAPNIKRSHIAPIEPTLNLVDWFDPQKIEHVLAFEHTINKGTWPEGFIPEHIEVGVLWYVELAFSMAKQWVSHAKQWIGSMNAMDYLLETNSNEGQVIQLKIPADKINVADWFDPQNIAHIRAYDHVLNKGVWPEGFIPEHIEVGVLWHADLAIKMAKQWINCMKAMNSLPETDSQEDQDRETATLLPG